MGILNTEVGRARSKNLRHSKAIYSLTQRPPQRYHSQLGQTNLQAWQEFVSSVTRHRSVSGHADSIMLQHACSENLQNLSSQQLSYAFDTTFFQFPLPLFVLADNGCAAEAGRLDGSAGLVFKLCASSTPWQNLLRYSMDFTKKIQQGQKTKHLKNGWLGLLKISADFGRTSSKRKQTNEEVVPFVIL